MFDSKDIDLYPLYIDFVKRYIKDFYSYDENNYVDVISIKRKIGKDRREDEWTFKFRIAGRTMTRKWIDKANGVSGFRQLERTIDVMSYHMWFRLYLKTERNKRIIEIINSKPKQKKDK